MGKAFFALRASLAALAALALLALAGCRGASKLPYYVSADFTPVWANAAKARSLHRVAPFAFTDQDGVRITEKDFAGKIYVADFIFTSCPGLCPRITKNLEAVQRDFRNDSGVLLLSHSIAPEADSVPALKRYAGEHHALSGKWRFVTGNRSAIYALARQSYFADEAASVPDPGGDFLHSEKVFLVDGDGHLRGVYNGALPAEMERLKEDIRTLEKER